MNSNGSLGLQPLAAACLISLVSLAAASCGSDATECISVNPSCSPMISTDFNTIYNQVFMPRCGTGAGNVDCHGVTGNQGGLTLASSNAAYDSLLGGGAGHARVIPGDPACSPLMARLTSPDIMVRMPKGEAPLADGVVCAVQQWIRNGASP